MIITFGGSIGSGKTTIARRIAAALGYEELYMGGIFRKMAEEKSMSIEQFYRELGSDPATELEADERQAELMRTRDNLVVQGRVSWYFAKSSPFKTLNIFLEVDPETGARRAGERKENAGKTPEEMLDASHGREKEERVRYNMLYGIEDNFSPDHYDIVLDTSHMSEDEIFERLMAEIREKQNSRA